MSRSFFAVQAKQDLKEMTDRIARENPAAAKRLLAEVKRKAKADRRLPRDGTLLYRPSALVARSLRGR